MENYTVKLTSDDGPFFVIVADRFEILRNLVSNELVIMFFYSNDPICALNYSHVFSISNENENFLLSKEGNGAIMSL